MLEDWLRMLKFVENVVENLFDNSLEILKKKAGWYSKMLMMFFFESVISPIAGIWGFSKMLLDSLGITEFDLFGVFGILLEPLMPRLRIIAVSILR